jgi:hypothetical protein
VNKKYGMFTQQGNALVAKIVNEARVQGLDWPQVQRRLLLLSNTHKQTASEAYDTVVREVVYLDLGYKTPFYGRGLDND